MKNEPITQRHKDIERFLLLVELFDLQYPTFYKEVKGPLKQRINNFAANLNMVRNIFHSKANDAVKNYLDNNKSLAWELIDEFDKAKDKATLLALVRAYNAGEVTISPLAA